LLARDAVLFEALADQAAQLSVGGVEREAVVPSTP
jgi:hypothetical protein